MHAALRRHKRHALAQIDPEFRIGLAEADHARPRDQPGEAERGEGCFVKFRGAIELADADGDVVDHWSCSPLSSSLRAKRSNPESIRGSSLDCFVASLLAMTAFVAPPVPSPPSSYAGAPDFTSL